MSKNVFESVVVRMDKFGVYFLCILAPSSLPVQSFILFRGLTGLTSIVLNRLRQKATTKNKNSFLPQLGGSLYHAHMCCHTESSNKRVRNYNNKKNASQLKGYVVS